MQQQFIAAPATDSFDQSPTSTLKRSLHTWTLRCNNFSAALTLSWQFFSQSRSAKVRRDMSSPSKAKLFKNFDTDVKYIYEIIHI